MCCMALISVTRKKKRNPRDMQCIGLRTKAQGPDSQINAAGNDTTKIFLFTQTVRTP